MLEGTVENYSQEARYSPICEVRDTSTLPPDTSERSPTGHSLIMHTNTFPQFPKFLALCGLPLLRSFWMLSPARPFHTSVSDEQSVCYKTAFAATSLAVFIAPRFVSEKQVSWLALGAGALGCWVAIIL